MQYFARTTRDVGRNKKKALDDNFIVEMKKKVQCSHVHKLILKEFQTEDPGISRMKSLMRSYVSWRSMDRGIERLVKSCKGCALAAKSPLIKFNWWPETDCSWLHLHINFAGSLNGSYYLMFVDNFFKWPEILRCKKPTTGVVIGFLHELFTRFGVAIPMFLTKPPNLHQKNSRDFVKCLWWNT